MPVERYFLEESFGVGQQKVLKEQELHHLTKVMRTQIGQQVELVNGMGQLAKVRVESLGRNEGVLEILDVKNEKPQKTKVVIAQAIINPSRLSTVIEKGTELGMTEIRLFPGVYSEKKHISEKRLRTISISALKQCGRLYLPKIVMMPQLREWEKERYTYFFGDVTPSAPSFLDVLDGSDICFFIGPESGFSEKEIEVMRSLGALGVKLHKNILRADTAPLVALSLIYHRLV